MPLSEYRRNLSGILDRLLASGATLVWASTTPVHQGTPFRSPDDVIAYNDAAVEIITRRDIVVNDLFPITAPRLSELQPPLNVHFNERGADVLAKAVASRIRTVLVQEGN